MNTDSLKRLWKAVFGDPDSFIESFFQVAYSPNRCRFLTKDGEIVSALYWFDCEYSGGKLAYIYAVATHPDHRGKGLASQLLEMTHAHLKAQGYAGAVLKPAKGLFPFYERLGYSVCGWICRFHAEAATAVPLRTLTAEEYAQLRKTYLPENAIIQEGVTLEFLGNFAIYYAAEAALVCASPEEGAVFEFLGNPHSAPGILAALGIREAEIPTPGSDIPFAMWLPLNCTKMPGYLGLSLE